MPLILGEQRLVRRDVPFLEWAIWIGKRCRKAVRIIDPGGVDRFGQNKAKPLALQDVHQGVAIDNGFIVVHPSFNLGIVVVGEWVAKPLDRRGVTDDEVDYRHALFSILGVGEPLYQWHWCVLERRLEPAARELDGESVVIDGYRRAIRAPH